MLNYLILAAGLAFAAVVQPGPFQAFLISQSLMNGWKKTFKLVFAPIFTDIPVIILVLLVLANIPAMVLQLLQSLGGVLLMYLAYKAFLSWKDFDNNKVNPESGTQNFFKALLVNIFNPNPYLAWSLVLGPIFIKSWQESPVTGIVFLATFYGIMVICSTILIMLFAATRDLGPKVNRISIGISAIALVVFGIYQLLTGIFQLI